MKKNTKITFSRSFSILAAAALSMTLMGGQAFPAYADSTSGVESGAVIPDNITIDSPTALRNIALPSNSYGTLSWVDGSYIPEKRVQSVRLYLNRQPVQIFPDFQDGTALQERSPVM